MPENNSHAEQQSRSHQENPRAEKIEMKVDRHAFQMRRKARRFHRPRQKLEDLPAAHCGSRDQGPAVVTNPNLACAKGSEEATDWLKAIREVAANGFNNGALTAWKKRASEATPRD